MAIVNPFNKLVTGKTKGLGINIRVINCNLDIIDIINYNNFFYSFSFFYICYYCINSLSCIIIGKVIHNKLGRFHSSFDSFTY